MSATASTADWFDQNAPKPVQGGDWFEANSPQTNQTQADPPGFMARLSERLIGTQHPIEQAASELHQLRDNPLGTIKRTFEQVATTPVDLSNRLVRHPLDTLVDLTGGKEFESDVKSGNYGGALGTIAGDVLPIMAASPDVRALPGRAVESLPGKQRIADALRTEGGGLKPSVQTASRAVGAGIGGAMAGSTGAIIGGFGGPAVADWITPNRASALGRIPSVIESGSETGAAAESPSKIGSVLIVPEPREPLPNERPRAMWSVPRAELDDLARARVPGAADVARNTGRTVIYIPNK